MRDPWLANGGKFAVTITAATLRVFRLPLDALTPSRSSIAAKLWRVNGEFRSESPVPAKPTTSP